MLKNSLSLLSLAQCVYNHPYPVLKNQQKLFIHWALMHHLDKKTAIFYFVIIIALMARSHRKHRQLIRYSHTQIFLGCVCVCIKPKPPFCFDIFRLLFVCTEFRLSDHCLSSNMAVKNSKAALLL